MHKVEVLSDKIVVTTDAVDRLFSDEDNLLFSKQYQAGIQTCTIKIDM